MRLLTQWAFTSSALILIVLAVRVLFRDRLSARLKYALWGVVLLRLLVPFQVELPAPVSDSVPLLVSNAVPEVGQWEERTIPVFPERSKPVAEFNLDIETILEPGEVLSYSDKAGGQQRSADGETIIWYRYLLSPEQIVLALWLAGAGLTGAVILLSNLRFALRLKKRRERIPAGGQCPPLQDAPIPVYTAANLSSPCLFGVLRPAVYLNPGAADDPSALRHVLAHELTHYAHRDHIWSLLRCLALALHWYNPLVWLAVVLSKQDGELACDEGAVARLGEAERIPYGRTLVDMVAARSLRPGDLLSCSTAMTGGESSIKRRVAQIVKKPETVRAALFAAVALVALGLVFTFAGRAAAEQENKMLLDYLDRTTAIRYCPPTYSSTFYPNPITDEDLLAQAKESLSGFRYLEDGDPQPVLDGKEVIRESRIILTFEGGEMEYSLLWQNDYTYLFPGSIWGQAMDLQEEGEAAQLQGVSGTCISKQGDNVISVLVDLARISTRKSQSGSPELDHFFAELESAQRIGIGNPSISNVFEPGDISDPAALVQAKELLSKTTPVAYLEGVGWDVLSLDSNHPPEYITQEELESQFLIGGHPLNLFPTASRDIETAHRCWLVRTEDDTLLVQWFPEREENTVELLAALPMNTINKLKELARTNGTLSGSALLGDLTQAQVDWANEAFRDEVKLPDGGWGPSEISCFFTSSYDDPTRIDLEEFLMYCPLAEILENDEVEEFQAVIKKDGSWDDWEYGLDSPGNLPVPTKRYPREKVSALLQKYAGVKVEELDWSNCLYVEEYDAFYNFTSDFGPGFFPCVGGRIDGDTVLLWSRPDENGERCELTLRKHGESWLIQSHHTIYER